MNEQMKLAVNAAMDEYKSAIARQLAANPYSTMGIDAKRSQAWNEYGFKQVIEYADMYKLYRRGGIAHGAINKLVDTCWRNNPIIIEGLEEERGKTETQFEREMKKTFDNRFWMKIAEVDRRRLIGRYAGLIMRIRDSQEWDKPVIRKGCEVVEYIPVWAGALKPGELETDVKSDNYGKPKHWIYKAALPGGGTEQKEIHPDRIIIFGDYAADAIGFLEPAFNAFVSLEKVEGGSGESFLKNAARQLAVSFEKDVRLRDLADAYSVDIDELTDRFNDAAREMNSGNDVLLALQGANVQTLTTAVSDPSATYHVNLQTVSCALDIPSRILIGNQQGERASTEDQRYFNSRCMSRRRQLGAEIEDMLHHMARIGVISAPKELSIVWDDLNAQSTAEKLESAHKMSQINQTAMATGEIIFTGDEIRQVAGYDGPAEQVEEEDDDYNEGLGDEGKENKENATNGNTTRQTDRSNVNK